jgi:hypothetical protein
MIHAWDKYKLAAAQNEYNLKYSKKHRASWHQTVPFKLVVKGKIEYLRMIKGKDSPTYIRFRRQLRKLDQDIYPEPLTPIEILKKRYDDLKGNDDPVSRGYSLQEFLKDLFYHFGIQVTRPFTRNSGAEQIDAAFEHNGWHYIVECRWRAKLANIRELDGLYGQVSRSGRQGIGMFI